MTQKKLPEYVWINNAYWKHTERSLFGIGYYKLTRALRFAPKGNFITIQQMRSLLHTKKALMVVGEPVKNVEIVDAIPYRIFHF